MIIATDPGVAGGHVLGLNPQKTSEVDVKNSFAYSGAKICWSFYSHWNNTFFNDDPGLPEFVQIDVPFITSETL